MTTPPGRDAAMTDADDKPFGATVATGPPELTIS
jgi:hypothetical protein